MTLPDPTTAPPWGASLIEPTDIEMARWLLATSEANRKWWFAHIREDRTQSNRCWMGDHEDRIEQLQHDLAEARARIEWLERHYCDPPPEPMSNEELRRRAEMLVADWRLHFDCDDENVLVNMIETHLQAVAGHVERHP